MSRPLQCHVVTAITEFAVEDYGSLQPSLGRVREGCLEAAALGAEAQSHSGGGEGELLGGDRIRKSMESVHMAGGEAAGEKPRADQGWGGG